MTEAALRPSALAEACTHDFATSCLGQAAGRERCSTRASNPLAPTLAEVLDEALTAAERERFVAHVRPLYEGRRGTSRTAVAYLTASKP